MSKLLIFEKTYFQVAALKVIKTCNSFDNVRLLMLTFQFVENNDSLFSFLQNNDSFFSFLQNNDS